MKKGTLLAAVALLAAALAGCVLQAAIPAFLRPDLGDFASPSPQHTASQAPELTPSPIPSAVASTPPPVETPAPSPSASQEAYTVIARYESAMPEGLAVSLKYANYSTPLDYFVALKSGSVYAAPETKAKKLASFGLGARYRLDKLVLGADGKSKWFHVLWSDKKGSREGYIASPTGAARSFRVGMMLDRVKVLQQNADSPNTVYVVNYKNRHGMPPALPGGKLVDTYNNRREQSAPAYAEPNTKSAFHYAPDGLLGTAQGKSNGFTKVFFPSFDETRWVPDRYLSTQPDCIATLTQVVVVDRANQNSGTFEFSGGQWKLIALTYVSTGKQGGFFVKTPLGFFMAQERMSRFLYYYDGTQTVEGYAPYAIRFSAGGYLHGVPRIYQYNAWGQRVDPGPAESLRTLGTTPQSHMCVRNYTSYAKFIYDWYKKGQCAVCVFE